MNTISALLNPAAYPHPTDTIQVLETHISWLILTGDYAYKIKKPVNFGFVDFSSLKKRQFCCVEELRLNQRLAADLYIEIVTITGTETQAYINGKGTIMDYAVKMHQFSQQHLLSQIAVQGQLSATMIEELAQIIAKFHRQIPIADINSAYGESQDIQYWFMQNFSHIRPYLHETAQLAQLDSLQTWCAEEFNAVAPLMQQRKAGGFIRECHADLHLGNIVYLNGHAIPFDSLEFNPALRWIDVISEVAFMLMDLHRRGFDGYATQFLNAYLTDSGDYAGLTLLPYYLVYRALVRAKVALLNQQQNFMFEYQQYVQLAERYTQSKPLQLIITHGYSGSGKSTGAKQLAEHLGLIHIRSDVERLRLFANSEPQTHVVNGGIYTAAHTEQTYQHLAQIAATALKAKFSVIVDATFLKLAQRLLFKDLAVQLGVTFVILDFDVPLAELEQRIIQRQQQKNDPSEATTKVLQQQLTSAEPLNGNEQAYLISASGNTDDILST